ncbi:Adenosylhomocysteinase [Capsicum baccatum]|uniref:Adenosylhomocysteinase n=1 Tax=Capsicum baccatum TaxID=33114 RepID=A0A2G2XQB9_CAPBA|nr:Adenosylhomocysteinase [Capsicum baccatum]
MKHTTSKKIGDVLEKFDVFENQLEFGRNKAQLDLYLEKPKLDCKANPNLNVLAYWKENSARNKVKDMSQADFGRLKIELADFSRLKIELAKVKMPGIMACRIEFGPSQPLKVQRLLDPGSVCLEYRFIVQHHCNDLAFIIESFHGKSM